MTSADIAIEVLSADESELLQECEQGIDRGFGVFVESGKYWRRIRDLRLYRNRHKTFADYCISTWHLSYIHVNRLIAAAQVYENLKPLGFKPRERQLRELTRIPPKHQQAVWAEAVCTALHGYPTAREVRAAAERFAIPVKPQMHKGGEMHDLDDSLMAYVDGIEAFGSDDYTMEEIAEVISPQGERYLSLLYQMALNVSELINNVKGAAAPVRVPRRGPKAILVAHAAQNAG